LGEGIALRNLRRFLNCGVLNLYRFYCNIDRHFFFLILAVPRQFFFPLVAHKAPPDRLGFIQRTLKA
jgi:hypothetical protein